MGIGRPSSYSEERADILLERIAKGELINKICAEEGMPSLTTIHRWLDAVPGFRQRYADARTLQADSLAEMAIDAAASATPADANVARVRFDAYRWLASKVAPRTYGDKLDVNHSGQITLEAMVTSSLAPVIEARALPPPDGDE